MSVADGLAWNEEDGSAILSTLTIFGRQADISWLHLSRKQDLVSPRGRSITGASRHLTIKPRGAHHDDHSSVRAEVATREGAKAYTAEAKTSQQEGPTTLDDAAERKMPISTVSRRSKPTGTSTTWTYVMGSNR